MPDSIGYCTYTPALIKSKISKPETRLSVRERILTKTIQCHWKGGGLPGEVWTILPWPGARFLSLRHPEFLGLTCRFRRGFAARWGGVMVRLPRWRAVGSPRPLPEYFLVCVCIFRRSYWYVRLCEYVNAVCARSWCEYITPVCTSVCYTRVCIFR
jgi:hypothetical protein